MNNNNEHTPTELQMASARWQLKVNNKPMDSLNSCHRNDNYDDDDNDNNNNNVVTWWWPSKAPLCENIEINKRKILFAPFESQVYRKSMP